MAADHRRGFALIFVIVTLAVMLILATVVLANTAGARQRDRTANAITELLRFGYEIGVNGKRPSFRGDVGAYPGRLSDLFQLITTTRQNSCGTNYSGSDAGKWEGPYHLVPMVRDSSYQLMPGLIAVDTLSRNPATGGANPVLRVVMRNVQLELAQDVGTALDGIATGAGPLITFTPNGTNPVSVFYNIPITGC
jgi:hypothetical protein